MSINDELNDYLRNGKGNRRHDQIVILEAYKIVVNDLSSLNIMEVTDHFEQAYDIV